MKKLLLGTAMSIVMVAGASAADMYVKAPPPWSWTGLYIGGNGGCGTSRVSPSAAIVDSDPGDGSAFAFSDTSTGSRACFGGGQIGANYQFGRWVVGVEADWQGGLLKRSGALAEVGATAVDNEPISTFDHSLTSFGTVRGRLGWAVSSPAAQWLPYVTGGWAWARGSVNALTVAAELPGGFCTANAAGFCAFSDSQTLSGWALGAGSEVALNSNWSVKAEYLHLGFNSKSFAAFVADDGTAPAPLAFRTDVDLVRAGLNYRFNWGGPVVTKY